MKDSYNTLADFLENGAEEARRIKEQGSTESVSLNEVTILSPVTKPSRIICQGVNYSAHREEAGLGAARPPFNMIFGKADSSLNWSILVKLYDLIMLNY